MSRFYASNGTGGTALGNKWLGGPSDLFLIQDGSDISLLVNADSKRTFTGTGTPPTYTAPDDSTVALTHDATAKEYIITDTVADARDDQLKIVSRLSQ